MKTVPWEMALAFSLLCSIVVMFFARKRLRQREADQERVIIELYAFRFTTGALLFWLSLYSWRVDFRDLDGWTIGFIYALAALAVYYSASVFYKWRRGKTKGVPGVA